MIGSRGEFLFMLLLSIGCFLVGWDAVSQGFRYEDAGVPSGSSIAVAGSSRQVVAAQPAY